MDWISGTIDQVFAFFQYIWNFFSNGIYDFARDFMSLMTKGAVYTWFKIQLFALDVAYHAAQGIMSDLGVSSAVKSYYGALPGDVAGAMSFFGVPQALNILFSALSTRFVLRFVPVIGR